MEYSVNVFKTNIRNGIEHKKYGRSSEGTKFCLKVDEKEIYTNERRGVMKLASLAFCVGSCESVVCVSGLVKYAI